MFGVDAPSFTIAGKAKTTSSIGFIASVILKLTLIVFATWKITLFLDGFPVVVQGLDNN